MSATQRPSELRVDPLTGLRTIVAAGRATRPGAGLEVEPPPKIDRERDPFAEGHEDQTPPELCALRPHGGVPDSPGWVVRVVPNRYPAVTPDAPEPEREHPDADLFTALAARGCQEVIVNAPQSVATLAELPAAQLATAMEAWRERTRHHAGAACVHVLVNERAEAGASLPHTHAQLYALEFVPAAVARERERFYAYATRTMGANLLADLVQAEVRLARRIVAIDEEAVLMCPYGARVPFQMLLVPRQPRARFEDDGPLGAALLHDALGRLSRALGASPPLNLWVRTAPRGAEHFCWRIDLLPRLGQPAGLELGTGVSLNTLAPEDAAARLREA